MQLELAQPHGKRARAPQHYRQFRNENAGTQQIDGSVVGQVAAETRQNSFVNAHQRRDGALTNLQRRQVRQEVIADEKAHYTHTILNNRGQLQSDTEQTLCSHTKHKIVDDTLEIVGKRGARTAELRIEFRVEVLAHHSDVKELKRLGHGPFAVHRLRLGRGGRQRCRAERCDMPRLPAAMTRVRFGAMIEHNLAQYHKMRLVRRQTQHD
jgi:hypothetical protein